MRTIVLDTSSPGTERTVASYQPFLGQGALWDGSNVRVVQQTDETASASHTATYMFVEEGAPIPESFYSEEFPETNYEWFYGQAIVIDGGILFLCYKTTM